jgi:hypothetical protein
LEVIESASVGELDDVIDNACLEETTVSRTRQAVEDRSGST